ncbi:aminotransferase class I/II-fold pyridoxal phosphate-dependent enzyme [uncultured Marinobacter sp.]|uniref:aminotransferase class I/II-fold pyridoxal phosphate-dependent enzyme n=1 Tax=uncultured Marinobacter sp. TaxID=187379 RepID=UPI0030DD8EF8
MQPLSELTKALHCPKADGHDAHSPPLWMTSAYDFDSAEQASDRFNNISPGNVYSRFTNPSVNDFERRLAIMEAAETAVATASGMAAYLALAMALLRQGDHLLLGAGMFGSTTHLFRQYFGQFGVDCETVSITNTGLWAQAIRPETRMLILETPGNPTMEVADIRALANLAETHGILLVVDNTILSPVCQQPLKHGAHLVVQSAGKFIDGQGRCVGGAIAGAEPLIAPIRMVLRSAGMCMSPFNAWMLAASLETLNARMRLHEANARLIAQWLARHRAVDSVYYTGLPNRPDESLISRQQSGHGALLSFDLKGGQAAAWSFINALGLVSRCTNIGDARTMVTHPWSTTHCRYSPAEKSAAGIGPGLVRLSVGLEEPADIMADLDQALHHARRRERITA